MKTDPRELMYWLQGFFEVSGAKSLDKDQTLKIRMKLESCFEKVTAKVEPNPTTEFVKEGVSLYNGSIDPAFYTEIERQSPTGGSFGYNLDTSFFDPGSILSSGEKPMAWGVFPQNPFPSCGGTNQPMTTC